MAYQNAGATKPLKEGVKKVIEELLSE